MSTPPLVRKGRQWFRRVAERVNKGKAKTCVAKLENGKAGGADQIVNYSRKYGTEGMLTMIVCRITRYGKTSTHLGGGEKE